MTDDSLKIGQDVKFTVEVHRTVIDTAIATGKITYIKPDGTVIIKRNPDEDPSPGHYQRPIAEVRPA